MDTKKMLPIAIIIMVVVGGIAFFGGTKYASGKNNSKLRGQQFGQMAAVGANGNRAVGRAGGNGAGAGGLVNGEILSKDAQSITIKLRDGGSKIVFFSGTTEISKFVAGTADDLVVGSTVMVNGKANTDGSVVAQTIQLRPSLPAGGVKPFDNTNGQVPAKQ